MDPTNPNRTEPIDRNNGTDPSSEPRRRRSSILWNKLNRVTSRFYAILVRSFIGRVATGYRRMDARLTGGTHHAGRHRCAPASPGRLQLVRTLEQSRILRGFRSAGGLLLDLPSAFYGLFGMIYGMLGLIIYMVAPYLSEQYIFDRREFLISVLTVVLAVPLLLSKKSLAAALGSSPFCRLLFVRFLGIPEDRLGGLERKFTTAETLMAMYVACFLGVLAGVSTLFIQPWVIPLGVLAAVFLGMIFAYPEVGVVLFTLLLPLVWLDQKVMIVVVGLILLTWCSYGLRILLLHRSFRLGLLDRVVAAFMLLVFATGFTGYGVTAESIWQSSCLTVCLGGYFLIVNLMNTRAYVRRCLLGVGISVVVVTALAYIRFVPVDSLMWLEGSRAGDAIIEGSLNAMTRLSQLWVDHSELYLVLVFPWLYAYQLHTHRLFHKFMGGLFVILDLTLIVMTDSVSALVCIGLVTMLFLLMLGHKWLSAGLLVLPSAVCGVYWMQYLHPLSDGVLTVLSRSRLYKAQLTESLWRMAFDHPEGIGVGDKAFAAVYPAYAAPDLGAVSDSGNLFFEILLSYGWAGVILAVAVLILFLQKGLTSLRHTVVSKDRAMILGGVTSLLGMVIFGSVRSFITSPRVFFTVVLVMALCSAYENIVFRESDVERVEWEHTAHSDDRFYRNGEYTDAQNQSKE